MATPNLGIHDDGVLLAVRGAVFWNTKPNQRIDKAALATISIETESFGSGDAKFYNLGHMSNDNLPEFSLEGGDATTMSTWLKQSFRTTYDATTGTMSINSVQGDKDSFQWAYNGSVTEIGGVAFSLEKTPMNGSLFVLWEDSNVNRHAGLVLPNVDAAYSALPSLGTDAFTQFSISATIKTSTALPKDAAGKACAAEYLPPEAFTVAA